MIALLLAAAAVQPADPLAPLPQPQVTAPQAIPRQPIVQPQTVQPPVATATVPVPRTWREVFDAIRAGNWASAQAGIAALPPDILTPVAKSELYTAKGSPQVDLQSLQNLIALAPELPDADQLARMAITRGATTAPLVIPEKAVIALGSAPGRYRARPVGGEPAADALTRDMAHALRRLLHLRKRLLVRIEVELRDEAQPADESQWILGKAVRRHRPQDPELEVLAAVVWVDDLPVGQVTRDRVDREVAAIQVVLHGRRRIDRDLEVLTAGAG